MPSRGGLLPAHPPLRTVRESFPSYGSSLSDQEPLWAPGGNQRTVALAIRIRSRRTPCGVKAHQLIAQPSFAAFCFDGSASSLARIDQTDVGISSALPLALAFSVLPKLLPLTRLAVRSARSRGRAGLAVFPCSAMFTG